MEKRCELPVILSVAPESMTHFEEEEIRHALDLPESAIALTDDEDFSDF